VPLSAHNVGAALEMHWQLPIMNLEIPGVPVCVNPPIDLSINLHTRNRRERVRVRVRVREREREREIMQRDARSAIMK
jgi:hypothetical protein